MKDFILTDGAATAEGRFSGFGHLMPHRVQEVLLVASLYDAFTLEEGGRLTELLLGEYRELNLSFPPHVTRASNGEEALNLLEARRFDLVITMSRLGDMEAAQLAARVRDLAPDLPVYNLAFNPRELTFVREADEGEQIDRFFLWTGDVRLLTGIIKYCEDMMNVAHDTRYGDVRCILLIEDSVRFYSSYLPLLYTEVLEQTQSLMDEGINLSHRLLRLRARPKILLATTFEEAWDLYTRYKDSLLGVIADGRFPWDGEHRADAGVEFIRRVKYVDPHTPAVLQSTNLELADDARDVGAGFIHKESRTLLQDLRQFMLDNFGFGDFVFRLPTGQEVGRAADLRALVESLRTVPVESVRHHAAHDHFSNWLRARTEFGLASLLRPRKVSEFRDCEELRAYLVAAIERFRTESQRGVVADFSRRHFDGSSKFLRIGGGSLGGKGRGLAFMNSVLHRYGISNRFAGVIIQVPPTAVVGTDVFDTFMREEGLRDFALSEADDAAINARFLEVKLPEGIYADLEAFLDQVRYPLAVRSSSLLEDSQFQPFAGVYATYMLPNSHADLKVRLDQLCDAIKLVYASSYSRGAKSYIEATSNRIEEEKMAVIIQQMVGQRYETYDYPHFAGVAHSCNFYPGQGMQTGDGVVTVALGLGRMVAEGGKALRFSPARPGVLPQFGTTRDWLDNSQRQFFAVDVSDADRYPVAADDFNLALLDLEDAERHGTLDAVGSVYSPQNDAIYDGIGRQGTRLVSFAHVLKSDIFPLADILKLLLELGRRTMSAEVEIEFAVVLGDGRAVPHQFGFLQIRPLAAGHEAPEIPPELLADESALVATDTALGNGRFDGLLDVLLVPPEAFDRGRTREIADVIGLVNRRLVKQSRPYLLIGPGRWGSADRWLGIPVRWDQISGAQVIVETDLADFKVTPSQGSHFFQNLTNFQVGYLTVNAAHGHGRVDWGWLTAQPAEEVGEQVRLITLPAPLTVLIDGRSRQGVVLRPDGAAADEDR
ncbi:MAG: PEP/pyruvate-binding domain-containing protein [Candidatus Krumholzibacteriia bacterium]